ncbi:MAG: hypothetical protein AAGA05_06770 [Pseudomonadota bacterium]
MRRTAVTVAIALLATPAVARSVTFDCAVNTTDQGWISPRITVTVDVEANRAAVQDALTDRYNAGQPVEARLRTRRNGQVRVSWDLPGLRSNRAVNWSAQIDPADGSILSWVYWPRVGEGRDAPPKARGRCETVSAPSLLR